MPVNSRGFIQRNLLTILTCVGVLSGVAFGLIVKNTSSEPWTKRQIMYIQYPGDLFLRYDLEEVNTLTCQSHQSPLNFF